MIRTAYIIAILFVLLFGFLKIQPIHAQDTILEKKIRLNINNDPLYKALIHINQITDYKFSYNSDIIDDDKSVSLSVKALPLGQVLDTLLNDTTLTYDIIAKHIVIRKKTDQPGLPADSASKKESSIFEIHGKVVEERSGSPLPYANIGVYNKNKGTISNIDGEFVLKLNEKYRDDTLVVSYMGYNNRFIPVKSFSGDSTITMEKKLYSIQEVIVRTLDADRVINQAFRRIQENYFFKPIISTGFYRETIKREGQYTSVSEAVIRMYKPFNKMFQSPGIKVLKSRKSTDPRKTDSINMKLKAGLEAVLFLDIIHENISFFDRRYYQNYQYSISDISHFDEHNTYEVSFSPNTDADIPLYSGILYIDVKNLALVSAEFHLNRENLKKISESLVIKKKWDVQVKPIKASYFVNYRRINERYFLNQIRGELNFKVRKKHELFADDFRVAFEMFSSNLDTSNVQPFDRENLTRPHKVFIEQIDNYDPGFWGEYNYIKPDEPIQEVVKKLGSKIDILEKGE